MPKPRGKSWGRLIHLGWCANTCTIWIMCFQQRDCNCKDKEWGCRIKQSAYRRHLEPTYCCFTERDLAWGSLTWLTSVLGSLLAQRWQDQYIGYDFLSCFFLSLSHTLLCLIILYYILIILVSYVIHSGYCLPISSTCSEFCQPYKLLWSTVNVYDEFYSFCLLFLSPVAVLNVLHWQTSILTRGGWKGQN